MLICLIDPGSSFCERGWNQQTNYEIFVTLGLSAYYDHIPGMAPMFSFMYRLTPPVISVEENKFVLDNTYASVTEN